MYYIRQKNDILVVAMQKISLATIFIRELNDFILISDFKYELNRTLLSYKKVTIHFCCFCSTATVDILRRPSFVPLCDWERARDTAHGPNCSPKHTGMTRMVLAWEKERTGAVGV